MNSDRKTATGLSTGSLGGQDETEGHMRGTHLTEEAEGHMRGTHLTEEADAEGHKLAHALPTDEDDAEGHKRSI